ncbi:hypothetical protein Taro_033952 [Colocasia esculenta]|uniref:Uncharacterized protein n=1 Tax=Colocasia esculenta TaxID=4460 RepID=A0A843W672_COLES|nr:hypothetical protein [Colocasia esculenta]
MKLPLAKTPINRGAALQHAQNPPGKVRRSLCLQELSSFPAESPIVPTFVGSFRLCSTRRKLAARCQDAACPTEAQTLRYKRKCKHHIV